MPERAAGVGRADQVDREDPGGFQIAGRGQFVAADDLRVVDADQIDGGPRAAADLVDGPVVPVQPADADRAARGEPLQARRRPRRFPDATVPVTTVPCPATVNERSIAIRKSPGSAAGLTAPQAAQESAP